MSDPGTMQQAFNALGVRLFRLLRPGEVRVVYTVAMVAEQVDQRVHAFGPDGDERSAEGTYRVVAGSDDLADAAGWLRKYSADPVRGAWFTAQVRVGADGAASIRTWLDDQPAIDVSDPTAWIADLETYPRSPEHVPAWLEERLAEGRRARDERDGWSPAINLDVGALDDVEPIRPDALDTAPEAGSSSPDFLAMVQDAVDADPQDVSLRISLVELLLEHSPRRALAEIERMESLGANAQTVLVLRARANAALSALGQSAPAAPPPTAQSGAPSTAEASADPSAVEASVASSVEPVRLASADGADDGVAPVWDVERPSITLADVAGLEEVKSHLSGSFLAPMRNPELARMFGKAPRGSLLMYGPPGCGKTFIARAIAGELGAGFVHATLADIMGEFFGQSEKAIHALFEAARAARPCVIFIDEFDAIGGRRTSGSGAASQSLRMITSQLLEEFDGVDASNDGIYVLAATNRPWDIDPALRRPGRLDRTVLILPPDEPAREAIIRIGLRDKPAADVDPTELARRTEQFSGADLTYVVDSAVEQAFMDSLQSGVPRMITTYDLDVAASRVVPSTRTWFEQIKPVLEYGVDDGTFSQLRSYIKQHRI